MKLLLDSQQVARAYRTAKSAHRGQLDKGGADYIKHPVAVAEMLTDEDGQTVALLHDIVEDTDVTLHSLREAGFSAKVIEAVDSLTKRDGESRGAYLNRVKSNPLAVRVKIADLTHNSDLGRIPSPTEKDFLRTKRYGKEINFLLGSSDQTRLVPAE